MMPYKLGEPTLTLRCVATLTLVVLGVGYGAAIANLYFTYLHTV